MICRAAFFTLITPRGTPKIILRNLCLNQLIEGHWEKLVANGKNAILTVLVRMPPLHTAKNIIGVMDTAKGHGQLSKLQSPSLCPGRVNTFVSRLPVFHPTWSVCAAGPHLQTELQDHPTSSSVQYQKLFICMDEGKKIT